MLEEVVWGYPDLVWRRQLGFGRGRWMQVNITCALPRFLHPLSLLLLYLPCSNSQSPHLAVATNPPYIAPTSSPRPSSCRTSQENFKEGKQPQKLNRLPAVLVHPLVHLAYGLEFGILGQVGA